MEYCCDLRTQSDPEAATIPTDIITVPVIPSYADRFGYTSGCAKLSEFVTPGW